MPWGLYQQLNKWFLESGKPDGIFGAAYAKMTVNLACRGDNTKTVCVKHLIWKDDSAGIQFAHEKAHQTGNDATKKLPRNCFCNPLPGSWASDFPSSIFHYFCLHPEAIAKPNDSILQGSQDAQASAFNRVLKKALRENVDSDGVPLCETQFSSSVEDITMYSLRKCSHTKLNCGSTAGPTSAAACLREGHSIGTSRNPYIAQEQASDEYCGRILVDLPIHKPEFAVSYPDFIPIDPAAEVIPPKSDPVYQAQKRELDAKVREVLDAIFTPENMRVYPKIHRFLVIGLASHLQHFEEIDRLLPPDAKLRQTPLFTNPQVAELRQWVRIAMPWEQHHIYFSQPSGIPPHVTQLNELREIKVLIKEWLPRYLLENRMNGPVSAGQIGRIVETSPAIRSLERSLATLIEAVHRRPAIGNDGDSGGTDAAGSRYQLFQHADGKSRRIPPDWKIPGLSLQHMYVYWHCGDESQKISPIKMLQKIDVSPLGNTGKVTLCSLKRLMGIIDRGATAAGKPPKSSPMTQAEANACFVIGREALNIPLVTPTGRPRNINKLTWASALKFLPKAK